MTFYNVISGILFLGACIEILRSIVASQHVDFWNSPEFWLAGTLATLIFNDLLSTSHVLEEEDAVKKKEYTLLMKMIDLVNFLLLIGAIVVLDPKDNFLEVDATKALGCSVHEPLFWTLLMVYWILVLGWNHVGCVYSEITTKSLLVIPYLMAIPLILMCIVSWSCPGSAFATNMRFVVFAISVAYLVIYKNFVDRNRSRNAKQKKATARNHPIRTVSHLNRIRREGISLNRIRRISGRKPRRESGPQGGSAGGY